MFLELWDRTRVERKDWKKVKYDEGIDIIEGFILSDDYYDVDEKDDYLNKIIYVRTEKFMLKIKCTRKQYTKIMEEIL